MRLLEKLAEAGSQDPVLINFARRATQFALEKNALEEAQGVLHMVQDAVRYTQDPITAELVTDPRTLVRQIEAGHQAYGDCDDMSALVAAMLLAIGIPCRFVTYGSKPKQPWEHIYLQMFDNRSRRWLNVDPIMKDKALGWIGPSGVRTTFGVMA